MARAPKAIEIKPGRLLCGLSADGPGLSNYRVKRDFRRCYDREIRAEGHDSLYLYNPALTRGQMATPAGSTGPVAVVAAARRGDGKRTIVAGSETTLWACDINEDVSYANDYFAADYTSTTQTGWRVIASGLSPNGNQWEAVQVGDYLCFNNGVDLPLTYRPGDAQAHPIYELREQGIASVGTIASHAGLLLACDLWQINPDAFNALMAPVTSAVAAGQSAAGVVSVNAATLFPGAAVTPGLSLFWGDGSVAKIKSVTDGVIATWCAQPIAAGTVYLENAAAYAAFTNQTVMQRYPWRILPSMEGLPRRFGSIVPVEAVAGETQLAFQYPIRSLPELLQFSLSGQYYQTSALAGGLVDIQVPYASLNGQTLNASVTGMGSAEIAMACQISTPVLSAVTFAAGLMEAADAATGYAGTYIDLVDDGGAILKAVPMQSYLVVYKETPVVFFGTFNGQTSSPYTFTRVPLSNAGAALYYRHTVINTGGGYYGASHIYAAKNAFYQLNVFTQTPMEIPDLQGAQAIFFEHASQHPEAAFATENPLTREWVFGWQDTGSVDRALCMDYAFKTQRTTSADICCAVAVENPAADGDWMFLFGDSQGGIQRYGLRVGGPVNVNSPITISNGVATARAGTFTPLHVGQTILLPDGVFAAITGYISPAKAVVMGGNSTAGSFVILPAIWHRNGVAYDSRLETGLGDLDLADSEKMVTRYVPVCASKNAWESSIPVPNAPVTVDFKTALNPDVTPAIVITATATQPHNLMEPTFIGYYVGANLTISGINNPFALARQIWEARPLNSGSAGRL